MRALFYGANNSLELRNYKPVISTSKNILVKMLAAAVHPADILSVLNQYPRASPIAGNEGVGQVIQVVDSSKLEPGDRVVMTKSDVGGVWAEYQVFSEDELHKVPQEMDIQTAATIRVNPGTALRLLEDYSTPEHTILLSACNSQVGRAILQIAQSSVVGLVRSEKRKDELTRLYPHHSFFLDRQENATWTQLVKKRSLAVAFDCVGGDLGEMMLKSMSNGSILCSYGSLSGQPIKVGVSQLIFENKGLKGFWMSEWLRKASAPAIDSMFDKLEELHKKGTLKAPELRMVKFDAKFELASDLLILF